MADRMLVSEVQQIGVESTAGTAVAPTVNLQALNIDIDTALEVDEFKPAGQLPQSIVAPRQEWAAGSLSGYPTYTEIAYAISNLLGAAVITTPSGATNARQWVWTPSPSTPWAPKTWTLRRGVSGGTAEEANYLLLSGLGFSFSRTAAPEISGDLFARRLDYAATLAATGVLSKTLVPILPSEGDIWLDASGASLGTTKLLRDFAFEYSISDLFDMIWPINSSNASFSAHSVKAPTIDAMLRMGNDAVGTGLVTNMRAGSTVFVRFKATSGTMIEASTPYSLQIDTALKVADAPSRADENGLSTLEWAMRGVYDPTWAKWLQITLMTDLTAL